MREPLYPSVYQINTRVWLTELSQTLGRPAMLDAIPDAEFDRAAGRGFDWVWLLTMWRTGAAGAACIARKPGGAKGVRARTVGPEGRGHRGLRVCDHRVHGTPQPDPGLARLRERLRARGLRLMLDSMDRPIQDHDAATSSSAAS
jgi:hypothetical protein